MYNFSMYLIEFIAKLLKKEKEGSVSEKLQEIDYEDSCKHIFLPVDSTGDILACSKCGLVVKSDSIQIKSKNPFTM